MHTVRPTDTLTDAWRVFKFGGSSVADASCMERVAAIIEGEPAGRLAVVLSASRGVTDALLALIAAGERQEDVEEPLAALRTRHVEMAKALCPEPEARAYIEGLDADCRDIGALLQAVRLARSASEATRDLIVGFGELWSTRLFARMLVARARRPGVRWVDARDIVEVEWGHLGPAVRWESSRAKAATAVGAAPASTLIVPGFIARDPRGIQ